MKKKEGIETNMSHRYFAPLRDYSQVFKHIAATSGRRFYVTGLEKPCHALASEVSASYFTVLEVKPLLGRDFLPEEEQPGQDQVMILSHDFWSKHFGTDVHAIGKTLNLDNKAYTIIGVMPPAFRDLYGRPGTFWVPMVLKIDKGFGYATGIARLKDGVTFDRALADMAIVGQRLEELNPQRNKGYTVSLHRLLDDVFKEHRTSLWLMVGAAGCVLLIACANAANLLFARTAVRQKEIALRKALGASPRHILRQTLTESILLSAGAGFLGLLISYWLLKGLIGLCPANIPRIQETRVDSTVFWFSLGLSMLTGLVFGFIPAGKTAEIHPSLSLKENQTGAPTGRRWTRLRNVLVVVQLSITLPMLMSAGLLVQSMIERHRVDLGFKPKNVAVMHIELPSVKYPAVSHWNAFFRQLLDRVRALPGIQSAALVSGGLSLASGGGTVKFTIDGRPVVDLGESYQALSRNAGSGYFETMGIRILSGRGFTEEDGWDTVVVDEKFARRFFPDENPIGEHIIDIRSKRILGVVSIVRDFRELNPTKGTVYKPTPREYCYKISDIVVRTEGDPVTLASALRTQVAALDKDLEISSIESLEAKLARMLAPQRFVMILLELFAGTAVILAAVGLYGVLKYTVAQRTHEIGVRMALGATRAAIIRTVLAQGAALFVLGTIFGLLGCAAATRLLTGLLYGVRPTDPVILASVVTLLFVVSLSACYLPARWAAKIDPMEALRYE